MTTDATSAPPAPTNPTEATTVLTQRMADQSWSDAVLAGKPDQVKEWKDLHALAAKGDEDPDVAFAVAGVSKPTEYTTSSDIMLNGTASYLREIGLDDAVIKQALSGKPVPKAEFDAVVRRKAEMMGSPDFVKRLNEGDREARGLKAAANIVLSNGYQESK